MRQRTHDLPPPVLWPMYFCRLLAAVETVRIGRNGGALETRIQRSPILAQCSSRRRGVPIGCAATGVRHQPASLRQMARRSTQDHGKAGYRPDKRLSLKVSTRDIAPYRDPAVILLSQLKQIYIDAELE